MPDELRICANLTSDLWNSSAKYSLSNWILEKNKEKDINYFPELSTYNMTDLLLSSGLSVNSTSLLNNSTKTIDRFR